jgi:hypothetical protein
MESTRGDISLAGPPGGSILTLWLAESIHRNHNLKIDPTGVAQPE